MNNNTSTPNNIQVGDWLLQDNAHVGKVKSIKWSERPSIAKRRRKYTPRWIIKTQLRKDDPIIEFHVFHGFIRDVNWHWFKNVESGLLPSYRNGEFVGWVQNPIVGLEGVSELTVDEFYNANFRNSNDNFIVVSEIAA